MRGPERLLADAAAAGVRIEPAGEQLRCTGPSIALTDALLAEMRDRRDELRAFLADHRPLSFAQERLWLLHQLDPWDSAYNVPLVVELDGPLSVPALGQALDALRRRHEILRTVYPVRRGRPGQAVEGHRPRRPLLVDLSGLPEPLRREQADLVAARDATRPFDLARGPVVRPTIARCGPGLHRLLLTRHHVAADGWSVGLLLTDLADSYRRIIAGTPPSPVAAEQFGAIAVAERIAASADGHEHALAQCVDRLRGATTTSRLVVDVPAGHRGRQPARRRTVHIDAALATLVDDVARERRTSVFAVLTTAFGRALAALTGQRDVVIGSPSAGAGRMRADRTVGCFAELLPIRLTLPEGRTAHDHLGSVHAAIQAAIADQHIPLQQIVDRMELDRSFTDTPLFQAVFALERLPGAEVDLGPLSARVLPAPAVAAKYPVLATVLPRFDGMDVVVEVDGERVAPEAHGALAERLLGELHVVVGSDGAAPAGTTGVDDRAPVTSGDRPTGPGLVDMIEAAATAGPDRLACTDGRGHLTYRALWRAAGRLARHLADQGVGTDVVVAVHARRRVELLVAVLGVLRAGGAYLAVEPDAPPRRTAVALAAAGARILVADPDERIAGADGLILVPPCPPGTAPSVRLPTRPRPAEGLAAVTLTSGSTAEPRAVAVPDRGMDNYLRWCLWAYRIDPTVWSLFCTPLGFDLSVTTALAPLCAGGTVHLVDGDGPDDAAAALRLLGRHGLVKLTPAHLEIVAALLDRSAPLPLRAVVSGGAPVTGRQLRPWADLAPDADVVNEYGPSETVVGCSWARWAGRSVSGPVPVGEPIDGVDLEVGSIREPAVVGRASPLSVGGVGVTRGYLGRPADTAEAFVPDTGRGTGARRYRTGDLVRPRSGGELDYVGRQDRQIDLRGFRIEPGEIEAAIEEHPDVRSCHVLAARSDSRLRLVAYVRPEGGSAPDRSRLHRFLVDRLPRHMIPAAIVPIDTIPLTANGKVDAAALPDPGVALPVNDRPPRSGTEHVVRKIWAGLLGRPAEDVGVHQDFFEAGGDSLLIVQLHFAIVERFAVDLPVRRVYQAMDVAALAATVDDEVVNTDEDELRALLDEIEDLPEEELRRPTT